jgi:hypothetical protein
MGCGALLAVVGCGAGTPEAAPYRVTVDVEGLMHWVIDPAADTVWRSSGSVLTEAGEHSLAPTDDAGWEAVERAAAVLAESGNLLLLPGRAEPGNPWREFSTAMSVAGERLLAAAEAQDADAVFALGAELYESCLGCHQRYAIEMATRFFGDDP